MTHPVRRRSALAATFLGTLLVLAPGAALADHAHHRHCEHRVKHHRHHDAGLEIHVGWQAPRHARHRQHLRAAYTCAHCHHGFQRRRAFYRHLRHAHGVPYARLPLVLVHTDFGWVFGR